MATSRLGTRRRPVGSVRASALIATGLLLSSAIARAEATGEIAARVALESPGDGGKSNWVDFIVEGGGVPSIERCERLVDKELKHVYPQGVSIRPKLTRPCLARPLPSAGPPMLDPQILRITEPLPSLDLMAVGASPTKGHIIRNTRMLSGVECEKRRDKLIATAKESQKESKGALDDEARLNQEQIRKACEREPPHKPKRGRGQKDKWLEADTARSRCEQAKRMGEILAEKRGEGTSAGDGIDRACVRF
jgi:hypothetical protein